MAGGHDISISAIKATIDKCSDPAELRAHTLLKHGTIRIRAVGFDESAYGNGDGGGWQERVVLLFEDVMLVASADGGEPDTFSHLVLAGAPRPPHPQPLCPHPSLRGTPCSQVQDHA